MRVRKINICSREYQKVIRKLSQPNLGMDEQAELLAQKEKVTFDLKRAEFYAQQCKVERVNISRKYLC